MPRPDVYSTSAFCIGWTMSKYHHSKNTTLQKGHIYKKTTNLLFYKKVNFLPRTLVDAMPRLTALANDRNPSQNHFFIHFTYPFGIGGLLTRWCFCMGKMSLFLLHCSVYIRRVNERRKNCSEYGND